MVLSIMILGAQCGSSSQQCARGWWYWYWGYWLMVNDTDRPTTCYRLWDPECSWRGWARFLLLGLRPFVPPSCNKIFFRFVGILGFDFEKNLQRIFKGTGFCSLASVRPYCNKGRRRKRDNVLALCGLFLTSRNGLKLVQGHFFNRKVMSN